MPTLPATCRTSLALRAAAFLLIASGASCSEPAPHLVLVATPEHLIADGRSSVLSVVAESADGRAGTGTVQLEVARGELDSGGTTLELELVDGRATAEFACDGAFDPGCQGRQRIRASWDEASATADLVLLVAGEVADGGAVDAGPEGDPDAGEVDAGPDEPSLELAAGRGSIFLGIDDRAELILALKDGRGAPWAGETVRLAASMGVLRPSAGGALAGTLELTTDAQGEARAWFLEDGREGTAVLVASHPGSATEALAEVEVVRLVELSWAGTRCGGGTCPFMGTTGSGWNEEAEIAFLLRDAAGRPVPGVEVEFATGFDPSATASLVNPWGLTDSAGLVIARVAAGPMPGLFKVKASVAGLEAMSPALPVRLSRPSNHGMSLSCSPVNVAAPDFFGAPSEVECKVRLVDTTFNPVGSAPRVCFLFEAGEPPACVEAQPHVPGSANTDEGTARVVFTATRSAEDVSPLAAADAQSPHPRAAEPSVFDAAVTRNPRDGLATLVAWVSGGTEAFSDLDSDCVQEPGEYFVDSGEPFLDADDDGLRGPAEPFVDVDGDREWDGPNGRWDFKATVWTETRVLLTGHPDQANCFLAPRDFGPVAKGTSTLIDIHLADINLNRPRTAGIRLAVSHAATRGTVSLVPELPLDGYGFGLERRLVDPADGGLCRGTSQSCGWSLLFYDWAEGRVAQVRVAGAPPGDAGPAQADTVTVEARVDGARLSLTATGTLE